MACRNQGNQSSRWPLGAPLVERTIAWLNCCHRLLCDFERLINVSLGWISAAMVFLMARRLAP